MDPTIAVLAGLLSAIFVRLLLHYEGDSGVLGDVMAGVVGSLVLALYFLPSWTHQVAREGVEGHTVINVLGMFVACIALLVAFLAFQITLRRRT